MPSWAFGFLYCLRVLVDYILLVPELNKKAKSCATILLFEPNQIKSLLPNMCVNKRRAVSQDMCIWIKEYYEAEPEINALMYMRKRMQ